jgi:hypothetical protein
MGLFSFDSFDALLFSADSAEAAGSVLATPQMAEFLINSLRFISLFT